MEKDLHTYIFYVAGRCTWRASQIENSGDIGMLAFVKFLLD